MKNIKLAALFGAFLFTAGTGCGAVDSTTATGTASTAADVTTVAGNDIAGEQLAVPDGTGAGAMDHAGHCGKSEIARLQAALGLTADQVTQIQAIIDATRQSLSDIRAQVRAGTLTKADAETKVKALHDQQKQQILALLTPAQQAQWSAMHDHHGDAFDLTRLAQFLGLSTDQTTQIGNILSATRTQIDAIHTQVEAGTLTMTDAHTQIDQLLQTQLAAIKALLTADQLAKLPPNLGQPGGPGGPDQDGDHGGPGRR